MKLMNISNATPEDMEEQIYGEVLEDSILEYEEETIYTYERSN